MTQIDFLRTAERPAGQLLKWIGNKFRHAEEIAAVFPNDYRRYVEPFCGTAAVLATVRPADGIAGDTLRPLIELFQLVQTDPAAVVAHYCAAVPDLLADRPATYEKIRLSYNAQPNPLDLLLISRVCYGGVIRFTREGEISTPVGAHKPMNPRRFERNVYDWHDRIQSTTFRCQDFRETFREVGAGDLVYCDPPYLDSQTILYGAQSFSFRDLINEIAAAKERGARVVLSIDGRKKSGSKVIELGLPDGLFERESFHGLGSSMLRRFQKGGENMIGEDVHDRLLLTW